ncbi:MAG: cob(I)yrinic acid a,c-diamide adenosyltransferase [Gammaproteobacteria bacterium]|nr:cob(I)yrinic acid a,c-diamide adenosyltransferase [Gammaproteobacteria bacterium]
MNERSRRNRIDRVTTRGGDAGETSLADGRRYPKHHPRIELVGALDEATSFIGLLAEETDSPTAAKLRALQSRLFDLGALAATGRSAADWSALAKDVERDTTALNERLEPLREFVLPGGGRDAASAHVARTVVRRAERAWWRAAADSAELSDTDGGVFLNRLGDYLFVLARSLARDEVMWANLGDPSKPD